MSLAGNPIAPGQVRTRLPAATARMTWMSIRP